MSGKPWLLMAAMILTTGGVVRAAEADSGKQRPAVASDRRVASDQLTALEALGRTRISAIQAADIVRKTVEGDCLLASLSLTATEEGPQWRAVVVTNDGSKSVYIDVATGKASEPQAGRERVLNPNKTPLPKEAVLKDMIQRTLATVPDGFVYSAQPSVSGRGPAYEIRLLTAGGFKRAVMRSRDVVEVEDETGGLALRTFDDLPVGKTPEQWSIKQNHPTKGLATWQVKADPGALTAPNVLSVETQNEKATFNLAIIEGTSFHDLSIHVHLRANTGKIDQGGGLVWRMRDENNYYVCRLNPLESNYRVYKVVDGKRTQLGSADVKAEAGQWYSLLVVMIGDHIRCRLDGKKLLDLQDDTFKDAGMIGLWTKADASSSFDNLAVREIPVQEMPRRLPTTTRPTK